MTLARKVLAIRSRCRVRRWEYRQRNLAHGVWAKFREALALAADAYAIDAATLDLLVAEGFALDTRGEGLEPPRRLVWISSRRAEVLAAQPVPLRLDATLLATPVLALVAFEPAAPIVASHAHK